MNADCGCCEGVNPVTPEATANRPGLDVLRYRVGMHASFLESMIAALTLGRDPALDNLTTRAPDDASLALLDAWATVADVLTFYQERIANEGYLRTATERRSILELGRLVGYELRPGVAASAYLAYTLDQNAEVEIPAGARAQSLPGPGELPQSFETAAPLKARGAWNYLEPRKTRPTVIVPDDGDANARIQGATSVETLYLEGTAANLQANDRVLLVFNPTAIPRIVSYAEPQPAANRTKVVLKPEKGPNTDKTNEWHRPGDAELTKVIQQLRQGPAPRPESPAHVNRRVQDTFAAKADAGPNLLAAANPLLKETFYRAWENANLTPTPTLLSVDPLRVKASLFGHNAPLKPIINSQGVVEGSEEWPLGESLVIMVGLTARQSLQNDAVSRGPVVHVALRRGAQTETVAVNVTGGEQESSGAGFKVTIKQDGEALTTEITPVDKNPFGLTKMRIVVQSSNLDVRFKIEGDEGRTIRAGQTTGYRAGNRRVTAQATENSFVITQESPAEVSPAKRARDAKIIALDAVYDQIVPGSWIVIERLDADGEPLPALVRQVERTATLTKTAFGITAKVTQLTIKQEPDDEEWLNETWHDGHNHSLAAFRNTTVYAQNDPQKLVEEPVTGDVGQNEIELQSLYHGLESGRWLIVTGERADIDGTDGVLAQELVMLSRIEQDVEPDVPGSRTRSTLLLTDKLAYTYKRDTVRIYANVVKSTHGETRNEILGSGNGSEAFQRFTLKQPPLTYVPATNASGVESTLVVRVNEVDWHRVDTLVDAGPRDHCYTTETDDAGRTTTIFGEGVHGARLPTGLQNVTSIYRNGIGKSGNANRGQISLLVTRPLGVKEVINPIAASGGADAESRDDARANVPLRLHALDRLVSVPDYEAFTRAFAGIGKAKAEPLSDGRRALVHLTIAGADDIPVDRNSDLYRHLRLALRDLGDPQQSIEVQPRELLFLIISATVGLLPDYHWLDVERRLRAAMLDAFSFKRRQLGQDVVLSEVQAVMHAVPGVAYVDVDVLDGVSEFTSIDDLRDLGATLTRQQPKPRVKVDLASSNPLRGAQLAILTPDVPDTLILRGPEK